MFLEVNAFAKEGTQIMPEVLNAKYVSFHPSPLFSLRGRNTIFLCVFSESISNMKGRQIFDPQQLIL